MTFVNLYTHFNTGILTHFLYHFPKESKYSVMKTPITIITGSNSGIGKAAAIKFAREGCHVVMACRNLEKSKDAKDEVINASGNKSVELMKLDISSFNSIKAFYKEFTATHEKLDILIHNAGYFNHGEKKYQLSPDGIELTFATNTFGPLLMTEFLRPQLAKSDDPRVLFSGTTNIKHFLDPKRKIEYDNLRGEYKDTRPYNVYKLYGDSKMAMLMLGFKMAEEYRKDSIKVNSVMIPNIKLSEGSREKLGSAYWRFMSRLMSPFARPQSEMADTYYHICTSGEFREVTGKLVNIERKVMKSPDLKREMSVRTNISELRKMTMVPRFAVDSKNVEEIWGLGQDIHYIFSAK